SNIAAEARAKIIYERLINLTPDDGVREALGFLMTREIAHQKSFEKALFAIEPNFPPGKLPGVPAYTTKYYDLSQGPGDARGPWNQGDSWEYVNDKLAAVDGGDGSATVKLSPQDQAIVTQLAKRVASKNGQQPQKPPPPPKR